MHEDHNYHHSTEVLNISNYNEKGQIVLNDEKLLELVQIYPFLYNPHIKPFRDPDYDDWAWNKIAVAFNKAYGFKDSKPFTVQQLRRRWEFLQPILIGLSKVSDTIPLRIRRHILKISAYLENQSSDVFAPEPLGKAQSIIFENIEMVEKLPLEERRQLEATIMRLILTMELNEEVKTQINEGKVSIIHTSTQEAEKDCEEFFKKIGIDDLSIDKDDSVFENDVKKVKDSMRITSHKSVPKIIKHKDSSPTTNSSSILSNNAPLRPSDNTIWIKLDCDSRNDLTQVKNPPSNVSAAFKTLPPLRIKPLDERPPTNNPKDSLSPTTSSILQSCPLLEPLGRPHCLELDKVPLYIRKCRVRLKRFTPPEDEIPLARIKREKGWIQE